MRLTLGSSALEDRSFILLAPAGRKPPKSFRNVETDPRRRQRLLSDVQRFRAHVYLKDEAIGERQVTFDRRHVQRIDDDSWHLVLVGRDNGVMGCLRYYLHHGVPRCEDLTASEAAIATSGPWTAKYRQAIDRQIEVAARSRFSFGEVGGWALDEELRHSCDALRTILLTYAWSNLMGGCVGVCTATARNSSAAILKRIGGQLLEAEGVEIPPYYDPHYGCEMQLLRFDSRFPNPKYQNAIDELSEQLTDVTVLSSVETCEEIENWMLPYWQFEHAYASRLSA